MTENLFAPNKEERRLASQAATPVAIDWVKDCGEFSSQRLHRITIFVFYIVETDSFMGNPDSEEVQDNWGWHVYSRGFTDLLSEALVPLVYQSGPYATKQCAITFLIDKGAILL